MENSCDENDDLIFNERSSIPFGKNILFISFEVTTKALEKSTFSSIEIIEFELLSE